MAEARSRRRGGGGAARRAERGTPRIEAAKFIERNIPNMELLDDEALAIIEEGRAMLHERPRADMQGFKLTDPTEIAAEQKYERQLTLENKRREAIVEGQRVYDER